MILDTLFDEHPEILLSRIEFLEIYQRICMKRYDHLTENSLSMPRASSCNTLSIFQNEERMSIQTAFMDNYEESFEMLICRLLFDVHLLLQSYSYNFVILFY